MMSPSPSTRFLDGMPCTISWLIDAQMEPVKPYSPLNAGVAPGWLRMNSSATASSSSVVTPGRTASRTRCTAAARIRPPSAISSISRALLSWITVCRPPSSSAGQRTERAGGHVLHRAHRVDDGDLGAMLLVPVEHRACLLVVDGQPVADRLGLVVLPSYQLAAALVARRV